MHTDHRTFRYQAGIGFKQPTDWQSSQPASIFFIDCGLEADLTQNIYHTQQHSPH